MVNLFCCFGSWLGCLYCNLAPKISSLLILLGSPNPNFSYSLKNLTSNWSEKSYSENDTTVLAILLSCSNPCLLWKACVCMLNILCWLQNSSLSTAPSVLILERPQDLMYIASKQFFWSISIARLIWNGECTDPISMFVFICFGFFCSCIDWMSKRLNYKFSYVFGFKLDFMILKFQFGLYDLVKFVFAWSKQLFWVICLMSEQRYNVRLEISTFNLGKENA